MSAVSDRVGEKVCEDQLIKDESFIDEFVCKICLVHVVGCGPKLTKCSHLFCGDCLDHWFAQHPANQTWAQRAKSAGTAPCPVCKEALHKDEVYSVDKNGSANSAFLWSMIQSLRLRCHGQHGAEHAGRQCCWTGTYADYWEHLQGEILIEAGPSETKADSEPVVSKTRSNSEESSWSSPPSLADLAEFSTDESIPEADLNNEVVAKVSQQDHEESEHRPVAGDLNSLIQALVTLKVAEQGNAAQASLPPGFELDDLVDQPCSKVQGTARPPLPPGLEDIISEKPLSTLEGVTDATVQKKARRGNKTKVRTDCGAALASELDLARAETLAQKQAAYQQAAYQRAMQWQAMQAAQWQQANMAYAGQMAQYQMMAQAAQMQGSAKYKQS
jgi:hypothetical protein